MTDCFTHNHDFGAIWIALNKIDKLQASDEKVRSGSADCARQTDISDVSINMNRGKLHCDDCQIYVFIDADENLSGLVIASVN